MDVRHWLRTQETDDAIMDVTGQNKDFESLPCSRREAMGIYCMFYMRNPIRRAKVPTTEEVKCYSEITQHKHVWGCSASSEGASQQRQQVYVDVPELAANAAQPTKPM